MFLHCESCCQCLRYYDNFLLNCFSFLIDNKFHEDRNHACHHHSMLSMQQNAWIIVRVLYNDWMNECFVICEELLDIGSRLGGLEKWTELKFSKCFTF